MGDERQTTLCPYNENIGYCPLFMAAHERQGFGCAGHGMTSGLCMVQSGEMSYQKEFRRMAEAGKIPADHFLSMPHGFA